MDSYSNAPVAVLGMGVVSSIGIGASHFIEAFQRGTCGRKKLALLGDPSIPRPFSEAGIIPEFDIGSPRSLKSNPAFDRLSALAIGGVGMALQARHAGAFDADTTGLVVGTSCGSLKSIVDVIKDSLTQAKPFYVNPAHVPNTVMNSPAGYASIWHGLRGVNMALSGGHAAGLHAMRYAQMALHLGYATCMVAGAVEEYCEYAAWGYVHMHNKAWLDDHFLAEGSVFFCLEPLGAAWDDQYRQHRQLLGYVLGSEVRVCVSPMNHHDLKDTLKECIQITLKKSHVAFDAIGALSVCANADAYPGLEQEAFESISKASCSPRIIKISDQVGDSYSADFAFQMAALFAALHQNKRAPYGLATTLTTCGSVGCLLLKSMS